MMRRFDLLIFDWDGTLSDSAAQIVATMQSAIADLGLPPRDDPSIRELIGLGLDEVMQRLFPELPTPQVLQFLTEYRRQFVGRPPREAGLFGGVVDALQALSGQGYRLSVATGKSRAGLRRALSLHHEVRAMLSSSRTADETASKPDPLMLRELLSEEGVEPSRALMIGDTEYDAMMAAAIGMPMLGVACGVHDAGRILACGAEAVIDHVGQLPLWLVRPGSALA